MYENPTEFVELDNLLLKMKQENEIDDFINRGTYPDRLKGKYSAPLYISPLLPTCVDNNEVTLANIQEYNSSIRSLSVSDIYTFTRRIHTKMISLENELQKLNIDANHSDTCPVCIEMIDYNNCVHPSCGHYICIPCFTQNIRQNTYTSDLCSICRSNLVV